jgi:hypothetical protein
MFRQIQRRIPNHLHLLLLLAFFCIFFVLLPSTSHAQTKRSASNLTNCTDVYVIGLRGSGEKFRDKDERGNLEYYMGQMVSPTYELFYNQVKQKSISVDELGLNYPARPIDHTAETLSLIQDDVTKASAQLTTILIAHHNVCPDQQFILMGYSQGAWVIHTTIEALEPSLREQIKAVVLYGDPLFDPSSRFAAGSEDGSGMLGKEDLAGLVQNGRDYCNVGDFLCNSTAQNDLFCKLGKNPNCPHFKYGKDNASLHEETSSWLAGLFTSPSNSNSPRLTTDCGHLKTPWVALYEDSNYSGRQLCFEGTGWIYLDQYDFSEKTSSVNIAANVSFYDKYRDELNYGYGYQTGNMGSWNDKIVSILVTS